MVKAGAGVVSSLGNAPEGSHDFLRLRPGEAWYPFGVEYVNRGTPVDGAVLFNTAHWLKRTSVEAGIKLCRCRRVAIGGGQGK